MYFNCEEKYNPGHQCKGKLFQLSVENNYLTEVVHNEPEPDPMAEGSNNDIEINLHALSGSYNPKTIRMAGSIRGQQLSVLIDSGSIHNFIQQSVAHRLGIALQELPEFRGLLVAGIISSAGKCADR